MQSYLAIVTHPFLWIFLGFTLVFFLIQQMPSRSDGAARPAPRQGLTAQLRRHYVAILMIGGVALIGLALWFYLFEVGISVHHLVDLLQERASAPREAGDSYEDIRNIGYTAAVLIGVLAASATLLFSLIRVWINERTARATEEGLITDRINKAVEGLGADKTVKRQRVNAEGEPIHVLYDNKKPDLSRPVYDERTEPNIEVRIGAILSLERIAQDSERDHIPVMEILCAYIRQNAGRPELTGPPGSTDPETGDPLEPSPDEWRKWGREVRLPPRLDIDVALRVISARSAKRRQHETLEDRRLNLQQVDLRGLILQDLDLGPADLRGAQLQGASLREAELQGADLERAKLQGAVLREAELKGADLWEAQLQGSDLRWARMQGADLTQAQLQGADGWDAQLQGAVLVRAQLQGAELMDAQLQGAVLVRAQLQGAKLWGAQLQGANLSRAMLQGADLWEAQLDQKTALTDADLRRAAVKEVDFTDVPQITDHLSSLFGDGSVSLPGGRGHEEADWPEHWPREDLDADFFGKAGPFYDAWRAWQRENHPDTLP
ncbi:pentapeptide repeat-containing protein [Pseudooceanicola sp. HF7]|uniref:pentapeptide repeat-containing protein n=1 Tax=Pseudooceanicola sp. HF7 TaxID=2721560 RepID=UPI001431C551|nr:pentapeptide repeat-containing protein [Pseudooceanicola sp. HF7]NIZ10640.1 pentapeptide repeat-containing protein [Pseudooceanicola sp. HF7]